MARSRNINPDFIQWGQSDDSAELYIGIKKDSVGLGAEDIPLEKLRIYAYNDEGENAVLLDLNFQDLLDTAESNGEAMVVKFREVSFCQGGQTVYMQVLGSNIYTKDS